MFGKSIKRLEQYMKYHGILLYWLISQKALYTRQWLKEKNNSSLEYEEKLNENTKQINLYKNKIKSSDLN